MPAQPPEIVDGILGQSLGRVLDQVQELAVPLIVDGPEVGPVDLVGEPAGADYGDAQVLFEVRGLESPALMEISVGNIIYGTEGFVALPNEDAGYAVAFDNKGAVVQKFRGGGNHFANFIAAVRSRRQSDLNCPVLEGHLSSAMCHLANISYRLAQPRAFGPRTDALGDNVDLREAFGRFEQHLADNALRLREMSYQLGPRLSFDPHSETFAGNAKADALLTREYRRPFVAPERI